MKDEFPAKRMPSMRLLEDDSGGLLEMASVRPVPLAVMEHQVERGERTKKVGRRQGKQIIRLETVIARGKVCHPAPLRTHHLLAGGWFRHPCTALPSTLASFDLSDVFSEGAEILMCV